MATKEELALEIQALVETIKESIESSTGVLAAPIIEAIDPELAMILDRAGQIHDLPQA